MPFVCNILPLKAVITTLPERHEFNGVFVFSIKVVFDSKEVSRIHPKRINSIPSTKTMHKPS